MTQEKQSIHEMLRDAEAAEEPGNMKAGQFVGNSDGMTMTATELSSAGWVYVYNVRTGDRSTVNRNMLEQQLQKTFDDGTYAFSTKKPEGVEPPRGKIKCLLHKDDPNRELYRQMGLPECIKDNLNTSHDLTTHMQKRHRREWASIDGQAQEEERLRDRERDDRLADALRLLVENNTPSRRTKNG
mgnify:FL=1